MVLTTILCVQFRRSFLPDQTLRLNDGPLGAQLSNADQFPTAFTGIWQDLNWVGAHGGSAVPDVTYLMRWALGPYGFCRFHAPLGTLMLGLCAWLGLRRLGFRAEVCVLGALAAALNSNFFSNACWGLTSRSLSLAMVFLAFAAIGSGDSRRSFVQLLLAGLAVGMGVSESADVGVIFSLFVAAYILMDAWNQSANLPMALARGSWRVTIVAVFAGFMAFHLLSALWGAGINPFKTAGTSFPDVEAHWNWATQWSLPKLESLRVMIAGLYGFLMQTGDGSDYWGSAGRSPLWEAGSADGARFSGAGEYAGVIVCLVAGLALLRSLLPKGSPYSSAERNWIWFWAILALFALCLSFGRHAPFYSFVFHLPYFSSTRNPIKWMHGFHLSLLMLFAYGLEGLFRNYAMRLRDSGRAERAEDRNGSNSIWIGATLGLLAFGSIGAFVYSRSYQPLVSHLVANAIDPSIAPSVARFSIREVWISLALCAAGAGMIALILKGAFARVGVPGMAVGLGALLVGDLIRADAPWIVHYNGAQRHESNDLLSMLADRPYEHRVTMPSFNHPSLVPLQIVHGAQWLQHQFPRYNIQSTDIIQNPRGAPEDRAFQSALLGSPAPRLARFWELTSTRYILGLTDPFAAQMNAAFDPSRQRFRTLAPFNLTQPHPGVYGARLQPDGVFSLVEFQGALPRARLYSQWLSADDQETLRLLPSPGFEPTNLVCVATDTPVRPPDPAQLATRSNVLITAYSPKQIQLSSDADGATVLLLNDKFHSDWKVTVDGRPSPLLRCNYLMRGVELPAGAHTIEFSFSPSRTGLHVSLAALALTAGALLWIGALARDGTDQNFGRPGLNL